jgi:fatty acid desaturase
MRRSEAACFVWGWGLVTLVALERLPPRALGVPLAVMMGTMALNQLRAHTAHRCLHPGVPSDEAAMVRDAVNVEARGLTRLCFPLGIELHALHHLEPAIPFHHLAEAHRRLTAALPPESVYRQASEPGLWASLRRLYDSAAPPARG